MLYKIDRYFECYILAPFLGERPPPEFLELHYKIHPVYDHVAKFHDDQPRDHLGDFVAKINITAFTFIRDLPRQ